LANSHVTIRFQGKPIVCRSNISVAAALWENGIRVLSHSPKYGRPRGVKCARGHCGNCMMRVDGQPNVRTCHVEVRAGMEVEIQDSGVPFGHIMQQSLGAFSKIIPNGFYYKWFTKPAFVSKAFIHGIRPMTGIGKLGHSASNSSNTNLGIFDTVVIGAGVSGMETALSTRGSVLLIDDHSLPGGQRFSALQQVKQFAAPEKLSKQILNSTNITFAADTKVVAGYRPGMLLLKSGDALSTVKGKTIKWCAGKLDQIGLFENNDLPGLIGPRGLYRLVAEQQMKVDGVNVVVCGHGKDFWLSAFLLNEKGANVTAVLDVDDTDLIEKATTAGINVTRGASPISASSNNNALSAIKFENATHKCELCVITGNSKPAYDIPYQLGAKLTLDPARGGFTIDKTWENQS
jgi:sarcosine oxidase, subunit alpha